MRKIFNILLDAYWRFIDDDGWAIASHIALSTLTALFPFLIFLTALAGFFGSKELADEAARLLLEAWPKQVAGPIAQEMHNVLTQTRGQLLTVSVVLALYFASSGVEALRIGLNRAYDLAEARSWWLLRLESIAYVLVGAVALLALSFLIVLGPLIWAQTLRYAPALDTLQHLITFARLGLAAVVLLIALILVHKWLPAGHRGLAMIMPGVAFSFLVSIAIGEAFGAYLAAFAGNYVSTYAGLASVMIALVFLYAMAAIFVYGGELNAAIVRARRR